jgi:hypothetical protein
MRNGNFINDLYIYNIIKKYNNELIYDEYFVYNILTNYSILEKLVCFKNNKLINLFNDKNNQINLLVKKIQLLINLQPYIDQEILHKICFMPCNKLIKYHNIMMLSLISNKFNLLQDINIIIRHYLA